MISHIHSTTITVSDQDAALDFYVNTLGCAIGTDQQMGPEMRFLTVAFPGGGAELVLADPSWAPKNATPGGKTGVSLISNDIDTTYATLTERGVSFTEPIQTMPWGDRATWFNDPDGNQFFLNEARQ